MKLNNLIETAISGSSSDIQQSDIIKARLLFISMLLLSLIIFVWWVSIFFRAKGSTSPILVALINFITGPVLGEISYQLTKIK